MFRLALATGALVAALVFPAAALGSLSFAFDRAEARQGQLVHAFQADADGNPVAAWWDGDPAEVTIYLVRLRSPYTRRVRLGPMQVDANGSWNITFRVPKKLRPGLYTTAFLCAPCGNTFFPSTDRWTRTPSRVLKVTRSR